MDFTPAKPVATASPVAHAGHADRDDKQTGPINGHIRQEVLRHWAASGEPRSISVSGNSMLPFLRDGDTVLIKPRGADVIRGDIVVYFMGDVLLIHRVVGITRTPDGRLLHTKGDFTVGLDPGTVRTADLVGKAVAVRRGRTNIDLQSAPLRAIGSAVAALSYAIGLTLGRLRGSP
jgi:signal peptidase I